jgi:hypothetical protein
MSAVMHDSDFGPISRGQETLVRSMTRAKLASEVLILSANDRKIQRSRFRRAW